MTITAGDITKTGHFNDGKIHSGAKMRFGHNPAPPNYFTPSWPFINLLKTGNTIIGSNAVPGLTANGYYDTSTSGSWQIITHSGTRPYDIVPGTYILRWAGTCDANFGYTGVVGATETDLGAAGYPTVNRREYVIPIQNTTTNLLTQMDGTSFYDTYNNSILLSDQIIKQESKDSPN
jgi:hypothetical protein